MTAHQKSPLHKGDESRLRVEDLRIFRTARDQPYAIVGHNLQARLITDRWVGGFDTEQEFRQVLEYICDLFETRRYSYWLADLRHLNTSFFHSEQWLAEVVFPRVNACGLIREAVVLPDYRGAPADYDAQGSGAAALDKIPDGRVRGFRDIAQARAWLFAGE